MNSKMPTQPVLVLKTDYNAIFHRIVIGEQLSQLFRSTNDFNDLAVSREQLRQLFYTNAQSVLGRLFADCFQKRLFTRSAEVLDSVIRVKRLANRYRPYRLANLGDGVNHGRA